MWWTASPAPQLTSAVSGPLGGTGVSSLEGRALAERAPGALHTPSHSFLHTQMLVCAAAVKTEGERPLARARLPHWGSALRQVAQPTMSPGQFGTIAGTVCREPPWARSTPDAGFRTCSRSHRGYVVKSGFIQEYVPLRTPLSLLLVLIHLWVKKKKKKKKNYQDYFDSRLNLVKY